MLTRLRSLAAALLHRERFEDSMADEVRFHMEAYADDLVAQGLPRTDAERRARLEFGGLQPVVEGTREKVLRVVKEAFAPAPAPVPPVG